MKPFLSLILLSLTLLIACGSSESDRQEAARLDGLARQQLREKNPAGAAASLEQARALDPKNPEYHNTLGAILLNERRYNEAKLLFETALSLNANHGQAAYNLGVASQAMEDYKGAAEAYKNAARIKPDAAQVYYNLGIVQSRLGDRQAAIEAFGQFVKIAPPTLQGPVAEARRRIQALGATPPPATPGAAVPPVPGALPGAPQPAVPR